MSAIRHVPVLKSETIDFLQPAPGRRIVDGTFGFGGHSRAFLEAGAEVLGLDLDSVAIESCREIANDQPQLQCRQISFRHLQQAVSDRGWDAVDGVLLDLGVSSWQLDDPAKGFSYRADGPLDLRFDQDRGQPAWELVAQLEEAELANLIWELGEERGSRRISRALVAARQTAPIDTTTRLREVVQDALPRGLKIQPVLSRIFQALRIAVNEELPSLEEALAQLPLVLRPGGRFVVISYHSLEDRRVKQFIDRERRDCLCPADIPGCVCGHKKSLKPLTKKAVQATNEEQSANPRSRSARLRAAEAI